MSTRGSTVCYNHHFKKGDEIEVLKNADDGNVPVRIPATVIDSPSPSGTLHVKFNTSYMENCEVSDGVTKTVDRHPHRCFEVGEKVEVFHEKGWRIGEVKDVLEYLKYKVVIGGAMEVVVENWKVRVYRDPQKEKSSELVLQSKNGTKLRIICSPRASKTVIFHKGTPVEVKSNEEGYHGSWYTATVVGSIGEDKLQVQYDTLTTDDEMQPLVEMADASNVRPLPPTINRIDRFKMLEEVDAWYNDGWWVGLVSKVRVGLKYVVYFWTTNQEFEFEHSQLRPHQDLINEEWVASFLRPELAAKPQPEKAMIRMDGRTLMAGLLHGQKVEIAHGEMGDLNTWYPAIILRPVSIEKYLVKYRTLKTNNGRKLLKEEVEILCIRPSPPIIQRPDQFEPHDEVEAWDVNRWRIGQICRITKDSKYLVYFRGTNNVVKFQHAYLRPCQNFIDGAWFLATKDVP